MIWFEQLSRDDFKHDLLLVVGDVANDIPLFTYVMSLLAERFFKILYVPGNHDCLGQTQRDAVILRQAGCHHNSVPRPDIGMEPYAHGDTVIVPLNGWYDYSFGSPGTNPALGMDGLSSL